MIKMTLLGLENRHKIFRHSQGRKGIMLRVENAAVCVLFAMLWACRNLLASEPNAPTPEPIAPIPIESFHTADGLTIDLIATAPQIQFPMFACFDDRGRLYVAESSGLDLYAELSNQTRKCRIRVLDQSDDAGHWKQSKVFAEGLTFPMGLAWREGKLFVADPPDLITLEDTTGDGVADKRTVILSGFGHIDNGSLHGLTFGPDGWLYMTMGTPDSFRLPRGNGEFLEGISGALIRCRPDGTEAEVVSHGFVNLVEVDFTSDGAPIATDNWFRDVNADGSGGLRDAIVHCVEGGRFPYVHEERRQVLTTGTPLPPISLYPALALSGITRLRGALIANRGETTFVTAQHNARKVVAHGLKENGATFESLDQEIVGCAHPDFHPSDVLEDVDGGLLVVDTGSWYTHHCPTGLIRNSRSQGGIYRVREARAPKGIGHADTLGEKIVWRQQAASDLAQLLGDPRPIVREKARGALSQIPAESIVGVNLKSLGKPQALALAWILAQRSDSQSAQLLRKFMTEEDAELCAAAIRAWSRAGKLRAGDQDAAGRPLIQLLEHDSPRVRLAMAEALGATDSTTALPKLWNAMRDDCDRFLEHALIRAIHGSESTENLRTYLGDSHPRVSKAALVLLGQPPHPRDALAPTDVFPLLRSQDDELREVAMSLVGRRPAWRQSVLDFLKERLLSRDRSDAVASDSDLAKYKETTHALMRVYGDDLASELADELLANVHLPEESEILILEGLAASTGEWSAPVVEQVEKRIREPRPSDRGQTIQRLAIHVASANATAFGPRSPFTRALTSLAQQDGLATDLRLESTRALSFGTEPVGASHFDFVLRQLGPDCPILTRIMAIDILTRFRLNLEQSLALLRTLDGETLFPPSQLLQLMPSDFGDDLADAAAAHMKKLIANGWRPREDELLLWFKRFPQSKQLMVAEIRQVWQSEQDSRTEYLERLLKDTLNGDPERGKRVFHESVGKVRCATCHAVASHGGRVGPDLTKIGATRSARDLLESIAFPSLTLAQGFETHVVVTESGRTLTGVISHRTSQGVTIRDAAGLETKLRREQIEEMNLSKVSLMPDGIVNQLPAGDLRDLIAYLQSLK